MVKFIVITRVNGSHRLIWIAWQNVLYTLNELRAWVRAPGEYFWWRKKNVKISCKCTFTKTCYHREINFTQVLTERLFEWLSEISWVCVAVYINAHPVLCVSSEHTYSTPQPTVFSYHPVECCRVGYSPRRGVVLLCLLMSQSGIHASLAVVCCCVY